MTPRVLVLFALAAASCASPCEKLADDVCAKLNHPALCADYRGKLAGANEARQTECTQKRAIAADIARDVLKADDIRRFMQQSPLAKKLFGAMASAKARAADGGATTAAPALAQPGSMPPQSAQTTQPARMPQQVQSTQSTQNQQTAPAPPTPSSPEAKPAPAPAAPAR